MTPRRSSFALAAVACILQVSALACGTRSWLPGGGDEETTDTITPPTPTGGADAANEATAARDAGAAADVIGPLPVACDLGAAVAEPSIELVSFPANNANAPGLVTVDSAGTPPRVAV